MVDIGNWLRNRLPHDLEVSFGNKHNYQGSDTDNCGVWIIHFASCLANGKKFNKKLQPEDHRYTICETLIEGYFGENEELPATKEESENSQGLENFGNSCWFNSTLQCLLSLTRFNQTISFFFKGASNKQKRTGSGLDPYFQFLDKFRNLDSDPKPIFDYACTRYHLSPTEQEDASEFLTFFLSDIQGGWKAIRKQTTMEFPFAGNYMSVFDCGNNHSTLKPDPFTMINLALNGESDLSLLIRDEMLKVRESGHNCSVDTCASTKVIEKKKIAFLGEVAIFTLKRFALVDNHLVKLNGDVKICSSFAFEEDLYEICGIVQHIGGLNGGHYVAYKKIKENWIFCSDTTTRVVKYEEIPDQGYIYFYAKAPKQ